MSIWISGYYGGVASRWALEPKNEVNIIENKTNLQAQFVYFFPASQTVVM